MLLVHTRTQHPVGQGFFHSANLIRDDFNFRYVYDCGAMSKYSKDRSAAIQAYIASPENKGTLDVLFLSHAHADHINGVRELLSKLNVDTIVLPLLSPQDRLLAFARSLAEDPGLITDSFYLNFITNPETALAEFSPRQILSIKAGPPGEGAPGSDGEGIGPIEGAGEGGGTPLSPEGRRPQWRLVGKGDAEDLRTVATASGTSVSLSTVPDTMAFALNIAGTKFSWLLAPYIEPEITKQRSKFLNSLKSNGIDEQTLADPAKLATILKEKDKIQILVKAYKDVSSNLNISSLCLYSGPAQPFRHARILYRGYVNQRCWLGKFRCQRVGWLGTGDAELQRQMRITNFVSHYGKYLESVATLTLPHHGSDRNTGSGLLDKVSPCLGVASADIYSTWRHPGTRVMQLLASRGIPMALATSKSASKIEEEYIFFNKTEQGFCSKDGWRVA